ncbi:MAG: tRNA ((37)-N1)-methyltransferase TrmD [Actinomycetota bacterium]|jgi:tRNA (guanine37-N1)-methyltransferase
MKIDVVTVFPEYLEPLKLSLIGKAVETGLIDLSVHDLRDYTHDKHQTVDDAPYGGGPGMVMKPEPWGEALDELLDSETILVIPTPSGKPFTQEIAQEYSQAKHLVFACGRFEGIDSRVSAHFKTKVRVDEVSIGDYVLAGGEAAVLVIVEALGRLIPGVLGNTESYLDDSFAKGQMEQLIEGPVFTRPPEWRDLEVPEVLVSGDHGKIAKWRLEQAKEKTAQVRPDLID